MQPLYPAHAFFVTGTDTDSGKTTVASALLAAARLRGLSTLACKPVASGAHATPEGLRNADAISLASQCSLQLPYTQLNPWCFVPAIAPHLAAADIGMRPDVQGLHQHISQLLARRANLTLIEGAGGWRVPLNDSETLADLAMALQLPVILVVGIKLGCINHALLTTEAIQRDGLFLAGWVANHIDPHTPRAQDIQNSLQQRIPVPLLGCVPWHPDPRPEQLAPCLGDSIDLLCHPRPATQSAGKY